MKPTIQISLVSALLFALGGCSTTSETVTDAGIDAGPVVDAGEDAGVDAGTDAGPMDAGLLAPPAIGSTEIDRMGRPAINTALTDPFDPASASKDAAKDEYNGNATPASWTKYIGTTSTFFSSSLAIFDSLDTVCGNQLAAAGPLTAARYTTLATVLADDQLYLDTGNTSCTTYLGVELNATGLIPNSDCGGRTPLEDVIDVTYSALAIGAASGVTDGVPADNDGSASLTAFPFLSAPN